MNERGDPADYDGRTTPSAADRARIVLRAVVTGVRSDQVTFIAASLAYYAFVSLVPLLLLALAAAAFLGSTDLEAQIVRGTSDALGPGAGDLVGQALTGAGATGATVVGLAVLLWSGLKLFRGLDVAFSLVYDTPGGAGIIERFTDATVALLTVSVGIAVTVAVGTVITLSGLTAVAGEGILLRIGGTVGLFTGLVITFLPLYYVLPDSGMTPSEALPGALFAATGWTILVTGFRLYAATAGSYEAYGVLGGVLLLVTFLYGGALVLLVGVVLNAVLGNRLDPDADLDRPVADGRGETGEVELSLSGDIEVPDVSDPDEEELAETVDRLHERLSEFEHRVEERTVHREQLERDLERYVRQRARESKARGWGPYLVLLYGTLMTVGAFFFLSGLWAVLAMLVIWLSTLGLYTLMLIVGTAVSATTLPGRIVDRLDSLR